MRFSFWWSLLHGVSMVYRDSRFFILDRNWNCLSEASGTAKVTKNKELTSRFLQFLEFRTKKFQIFLPKISKYRQKLKKTHIRTQCLKTIKNRQLDLKYYFIQFGANLRSDYECKPLKSAEKIDRVRKTLLWTELWSFQVLESSEFLDFPLFLVDGFFRFWDIVPHMNFIFQISSSWSSWKAVSKAIKFFKKIGDCQ